MDYVDENEYIISCAYDSIGREEINRFFYADFIGVVTSAIDAVEESIDKKMDSEFKNYMAKFYTEAISGMLIDWVKARDKHNKEKVIGYLITLIGTALDSVKMYSK